MARGLVLLTVAGLACGADPQRPIGTTEWVVELPDYSSPITAGPDGGVVLDVYGGLELLAPDGARAWHVCIPDVEESESDTRPPRFAVTAAGDVVAIEYANEGLRVRRYARADGRIAWSHVYDTGESIVRAAPAVGSDGRIRVLVTGLAQPVDFGTGPIGGQAGEYSALLDFDLDGELGSASPVDLDIAWVQVHHALDSVLVVGSDRGPGWLVELELDGQLRPRQWPDFPPDGARQVVVHEDGEISVLAGGDIVRLDGERRERWREMAGASSLSALSGGRLMASVPEGIASESMVTALRLLGPDGALEAEELISRGSLRLLPSTPGPDYWLWGEVIFGELDLHDDTAELEGGPFVVRRSGAGR